MHISREYSESYIAHNDFLDVMNFNEIGRYIKSLPFSEIQNNFWKSSDDNKVISSNPIIWTKNENILNKIRSIAGISIYPTFTSIDVFIESVVSSCIESKMYGEIDKDWFGIVMSVYVSKKSSELSWHVDGESYQGAFVYYVHDYWGNDWGGELLIKNNSDDGIFLSAIPNRLVLIKGGTPHCVRTINSNSDRISIAGFLVNENYIMSKLKC